MEPTSVPRNKRTDKGNGYTHSGIISSRREEWSYVGCKKMDVSTDNRVKWMKLVSDKNRTCTDDMTIKVRLSGGRETPGKGGGGKGSREGEEGGKGSRGWMRGCVSRTLWMCMEMAPTRAPQKQAILVKLDRLGREEGVGVCYRILNEGVSAV